MRVALRPGGEASARLLAGCAVGFVGTWNVANIGAVATPLAQHYHAGLATIGLFTTAIFLGEVVGMIPGGLLIDRFGAKRVGLGAMGVCLAGNLGLLLTDAVAVAIGVRWVVGMAVGTTFLAGSAYVRTAGQSSFFQGLYGGASLSAGGVALAVVPQLSGPLGWRASYVSALAVAGVAIVFVAACPPTGGQERSGASTRLLTLAFDRRLAQLGMLSAAGFGITVIVGNWAPTLLERTGGYDEGTAGAVAGLTILLGIVGRPLGGTVARRLPSATRALIAGSFATGALATALLAAGGPLALLVPAAVAVGVAGGVPFGPIMFGATRVYPEAPGAAIGAMNVYPGGAIVAAMPLVGLTFALPGDGRIGFAVLAGLWALAACAVPPSSALR